MQRLKKIPLFLLLTVTTVLFSAIALLGKRTVYASYETDVLTEPVFTPVFFGVRDEIYPTELVYEAGRTLAAKVNDRFPELRERFLALEDRFPILGALGARIEEGNTAAPAVYGNRQTAGAGASAGGVAAVADETAIAGYADEEAQIGEGYAEIADGSETTGELSLEIPAGVNDPVVQAEDFGNTSSRFRAAAGTAFLPDAEGIFAPNGIYYYQQAVGEEYFDDALFIGDSRTVGLAAYGHMEGHANFFAKNSMNVYRVFDKKMTLQRNDGTKQDMTLAEALSERQYGKVYVCLGVNELGIGTTMQFYDKYRELLIGIRELQPEAIIYIEGIMHVTRALAQKDNVLNNTLIVERNTAIASLANGRDVFYIDMNMDVCDENGNLRAEYSGDGIHTYASTYALWKNFLLKHAIIR